MERCSSFGKSRRSRGGACSARSITSARAEQARPLLLWQRLVERGDDRSALFLTRTGFVFVRHDRARGDGLRLLERQARSETLHLLGVEHLAREQRVGNLHQRVLVRGEQLRRALIVVGDELLHFLIDLDRGVFAVILVLRDLAAEEDLLFLLAE